MDRWDISTVTDGMGSLPVCAALVGRLIDDWCMSENSMPKRVSLWMRVRNYPVPWFLFLVTTLTAVVLSFR